jgi:hypothetical protein
VRISGPTDKEVIGDLRKLYNEELQNVYSLLFVVRFINSMSIR